MSLFRLHWVGAWTYWILLFGVFAGFPLFVWAIRLALKAEEEHDHAPAAVGPEGTVCGGGFSDEASSEQVTGA
jgi:hypothetical protein